MIKYVDSDPNAGMERIVDEANRVYRESYLLYRLKVSLSFTQRFLKLVKYSSSLYDLVKHKWVIINH